MATHDISDSAYRDFQIAGSGSRASEEFSGAGRIPDEAINRVADVGAAKMRGGERQSVRARTAADPFDVRASSLEETVRDNPLAAAGAALLIGVVLGRFVL